MNISPSQVTLSGLDTQTFRVENAPAGAIVTWRLEPPDQGQLTAEGIYKAPKSVFLTRKVVVVAQVGIGDTTQKLSAEIELTNTRTVVPLLYAFLFLVSCTLLYLVVHYFPRGPSKPHTMVIGPTSVVLMKGQSQAFATSAPAGWSPNAPNGVFTAGDAARDFVVATRHPEADQSAVATVTVGDASLTIEPPLAQLGPGEKLQLVARLRGPDGAIDGQLEGWTIEGCSEHCADEGKFTAPASIDEERVIIATVRATVKSPTRKLDANNAAVAQPAGEGKTGTDAKASTSSKPVENKPAEAQPAATPKENTEVEERQLSASMPIRLIPKPLDSITVVLFSLVFGALGGLLHAIKSLVAYVGSGKFASRWALFYFSQPFVGAVMALFVVLVFKGQLANNAVNVSDFFTIAGVAALTGLFSDSAAQKLKEIFDVVLGPKRDARADTLGNGTSAPSAPAVAKPTITAVKPTNATLGMPVKLTVSGTGFSTGCTGQVNHVNRTTTGVSTTELSIELKDEDVAAVGDLAVTVVNANGDVSAVFKVPVV